MTVYTSEDNLIPTIVVECSCGSASHMLWFSWLEDLEEFSIQPRLITWQNIFRRMWTAFLYVIGHKSRFGEFDEILIGRRDAKKIAAFLLRYSQED